MVCGLRLVSSKMIAVSSLRSGYLALRSFSSGPIVPGRSPPLMTWQVRQLPLAAVESEFLALGHGGLRPHRGRGRQEPQGGQRNEQGGFAGKGGQGVVPKHDLVYQR
ncbi:hypothetical protein ACVWW5_007892 [Bradyrhizobium sp. LM3.4]